jgi:predicted amidohydrolase YtcJ
LEEALECHTLGAARACHADAWTGSIEVGKRADIVALDRDVLEGPVDDVHRARVRWTMVAGRVVYRAVDEGPKPCCVAAGRS